MLKRFIFWEYARGSWQYDVIVGIIVAFVFLTPREWLRDQPRIPEAGTIVLLPSDHGTSQFLVNPAVLAGVPKNVREANLTRILRGRGYPQLTVTRVDPIVNQEGELESYVAITKP
jgi:hypothetical protein